MRRRVDREGRGCSCGVTRTNSSFSQVWEGLPLRAAETDEKLKQTGMKETNILWVFLMRK